MGLMNLSTCCFGHFPSCHGCGGLAGQHHFGARSGSSMVFIGLLKMVLAVIVGPSMLHALETFPSVVLGVLLAVSGIELATSCADIRCKADLAVALAEAGIVIRYGTGQAFIVSLAISALLRALVRRPSNSRNHFARL
mmetsp:Transcript_25897/g.42783  ORF Transcript_25897/g.42783 Transcript_25897/m.42783 type:complete len:138 (+) Transcript_25897:1-414(+)